MGCFSDAVRADPGDLETDNNLPPSMSGSVLITALLRTSQAACAGSENRVLEPSARRSSFRERHYHKADNAIQNIVDLLAAA